MMMISVKLGMVGLLWWGLALSAWAAGPGGGTGEELVRVEVQTDAAGIEPGEAFTVGVLLNMEEGWHVYWKNPGDAGLATEVALDLPEGFEAEAMHWPLPIRFDQPGNVAGYGYEDQVMLMVPVRAPADLKAGEEVTIPVKVRWLVCKDVCLPGEAERTLTLPVVAQAEASHEALFQRWRERLPGTQEESPMTESRVTGSLPAGAEQGRLTLLLRWEEEPAEVTWFPEADFTLGIENVQVRSSGKATRIDFTARAYGDRASVARVLPSLVVYEDQDGQRRGFPLEVPLWDAGKKSDKN